MKTILLSIFLLGCVGFTYAQQPAATTTTPVKKANTIILQTPDSARAALKQFGAILVAQGFTIQKADYEFGTLVTAPRALSGGIASALLTLQVRATPGANSSLMITGQNKTTVGQYVSTMAMLYQGSEGGVIMQSFRAAEKAAKSYPKGVVSYAKD